MAKHNNETLNVAWVMANKQTIKFKEKEETFDIAENVMKFIDKISSGDTVEVGFQEEEVVFLKKVKQAETKKAEATSEAEETVLTVQGVPSAGFSILFQERENVWYPVKKELQSTVKNFKKNDKVKVKIGLIQVPKKAGGTYPKEGIDVIEKVEENEEPETKTEEAKTTTSKDTSYQSKTNTSIENQVALKGAVELGKVFVEKGEITIDNVDKAIKKLTKICKEAIKE